MFTTAANRYDHAVTNVANAAKLNLSATFGAFNNGTSLQQQSVAVGSAMEQSLAGLEQARDIRVALAKQADAPQADVSSAVMGGGVGVSGWPTLKGEILGGIAIGAVGMMNAPAAAVLAVGAATIGAAKWAMSSPGGAEHAGVLHAAVDAGATSFKDYGSTDVAGKDGYYTDVLGESWHADGTAVGKGITTPAPAMRPLDPALMQAAGLVVADMGADRVRDDLMFASVAEKRLEQQAGAAMQHHMKVIAPALTA